MVKEKEECKDCLYLHPKSGTKKYKCYCGNCPAKIKNDKARKKFREKVLRIKKKY